MAERVREPNAPPGVAGYQGRSTQRDRIATLRSRVSRARQVRQDWQRRYSVKELYERFYGSVESAIFNTEEGLDSFAVNKILPTVKTIVPSLFLQNPTFIVRSKSENVDPSSVLKAKMGEGLLRAIAEQEHHLEFSAKLAILQSFFSIGVLKCVYEPKLLKNPRAGEIMYEREPSGIPIRDEQGQLTPILDDNGFPMEEPSHIVDDEAYRWDWVNGDRMLLPDAGPAHLRWPWIAEEVTVLLDHAREDQRFSRNLRTQLRSNVEGFDGDELSGPRIGTPMEDESMRHEEYITYIECWDIRKRRHYIWAEGQTFSGTQLLLDEDTPAGYEAHPYALLMGYIPIIAPKSSPWPLPLTHSWLGLQRESNVRRRQLANGAKRSARKVFYTDGTFEDAEEAVNFLQSSEDMQGVKITSMDQAPVVHADKELPVNISQDMALLDADWNFQTGVAGPRSGTRNKGAESVYESKVQVASSEMRELDMRHDVNVWLASSGMKMFRLVKQTMTISRYIRMRGTSDSHFMNYISRVYGPEFAANIQEFPHLRMSFDQEFGDDRWLEVSGEDLDFQADVSIAPGSARPRNQEAEKQDFLQVMTLLGSLPILQQSRALLNRIAAMFEFFDVSMIDEILAAGQRTQMLEQMKAGRLQGGGQAPQPPMPAAMGNGSNMTGMRRLA